MSYGPITHAGSNWRKLCAKYGLDPLEATAAGVELKIKYAAARPILDAFMLIFCDQAAVIDDLAAFTAWHAEFRRLTGPLEDAIINAFIVPPDKTEEQA